MFGECYIYVEYPPGQPGTPQGSEAVCNHDTTTYSTTGATSANNYSWSLTPASAGTLTQDGLTTDIAWELSFTGTATLTVTGSNDCGDGPVSEELQIEVVQTPAPVVEGEAETCQGYAETYSTEGNESNAFFWGASGGEIVAGAGTSEIIVLWGPPGMGYVGVTEYNGTCMVDSETFEVVIDECTFVDEFPHGNLKIYPNPADNLLAIDLSGIQAKSQCELSIRDISGKLIDKIRVKTSSKVITLNTTEYKPGIYSISISDDSGTIAKTKFIISR
jgi:hypothetical protein